MHCMRQLHHDKEIPWFRELLPRTAANTWTTDLFYHTEDKVECPNLADIIGSKSSPDWYSPTPILAPQQFAFCAVYHKLGENPDLALHPTKLWQCAMMLGCKDLVVVSKSGGPYLFPVGVLG